MSNSTIKRGSKLTVTTDKGITNLTNTNNIGIAEISGPVMTDISDSFKLTSITNANLPQLRIGTTDSSGSLQLGVFKNSNNKTLSILQSSFESSTGDNDNVKGYNHLTLQPKGGNLGIRTNDPLAIFDINNTAPLEFSIFLFISSRQFSPGFNVDILSFFSVAIQRSVLFDK